jgi:hypothetical protein
MQVKWPRNRPLPAHYGHFHPFGYDFYASLTTRHALTDLYRRLRTDWTKYSRARRRLPPQPRPRRHRVPKTRQANPDGTRPTDHSAPCGLPEPHDT